MKPVFPHSTHGTVRSGVVVAFAILAMCLAVFLAGPFMRMMTGVHSPRTGSDVSPSEVPFLQLPLSATQIGYWDDGYFQAATFEVPEADFIAMFPEFAFSEIQEAIAYPVWQFGRLDQPPRINATDHASAKRGLFYHERWENGGGYYIVYDRDRSFASYRFNRW